MKDSSKTNQDLIEEISALKQRIKILEQSESKSQEMDQAFRRSEGKYRTLIENIHDGIYILDPFGKFTFVNDIIVKRSGFPAEWFLGRSYLDVIIKEDHERVQRYFNASMDGKPQIYDLAYPVKSGDLLHVEVCTAPLFDNAKVIGLIGISRDITERKRDEEEKRRSHETAERLAEEMAIIAEIGRVIGSTLNIDEVYERFAAEVRKLIPFDRIHVNLKDPDGEAFTIAYVSGTDIAGRRPGDKVPLAGTISEVLCRTRTGLLFHPVNEEEIFGRFPSASAVTTFRAGMRSIMAVPLISRDEVIGLLHFRSKTPNAYTEQDLSLSERIGSQIAGAIANAQIFKTLVRTERELRESEEKYRILFNNERASIYIFDLETLRFLDANDSSLRLYGYSREEMLGGMRAIDISAEPEKSADSYKVASESGTIFIPLRWHRKKDGTVFPVEIVVGPYVWKGRRVMFGLIQDISDRKQAEEVLKETLNQLESRVKERTLELEETNTALRVLLKKGDKDQKTLEENLQSNINQLVTPFLSKLRVSQSDSERLTYLNILESNLDNIVSPFINRLSAAYKTLTPKEIQIAELIKQGKRSKEIAELFGISVGTVLTHRNKIRKKLDLKSKDANLRSHLLSLA